MPANRKSLTAPLPAIIGGAVALATAIAGVGFARWRRRQAENCNPGTAARREGEGDVRSAGPEGMRSKPKREWTVIEQSSDESFPASDPPATY